MKLSLVVAVDGGWHIGKDGGLQAHVGADLKHFRKLTEGKTVILGSKTLATFPGGRPLPRRRNLILSRSMDAPAGAEVCRTVEDLPALLGEEPAVVIGGESVYRQLLPACDEAFVTRFDRTWDGDASFPDLTELPEWSLAAFGPWHSADGERDEPRFVGYRFEWWRKKTAAGCEEKA